LGGWRSLKLKTVAGLLSFGRVSNRPVKSR
jgi:hypothetical protein